MPTIHLIDGEKGGVGKSFVARSMIQYCIDRNLPYVAIETDRSNPDVAGVYKGICKFAVFTEDEKQSDKADSIFEFAINKPVIVSLPSQVHRAMKTWIDRNDLLNLCEEYQVNFVKWFVCNGEYDSVNLFANSLKSYENGIPHILVRNLGLCNEWSQVDEDQDLQKLIKKYKVKVIDFPKLEYGERYLINKKRLKFDQVKKDKDFSILSKQRVRNFLKSAYTTFDAAGVWDVK